MKNREPLFHIVKRTNLPFYKKLIIRALSILGAFLLCSIIIAIFYQCDPITFLTSLFSGVFGTKKRIWNTVYYLSILLGLALGLAPAFKMKFWNTGADGQALAGGLACCACMFYMQGKASDGLIILVSFISAIIVGMIWAVIPAIFKAFFNTNETLFTLMMNYVAIQLVSFAVNSWDKSGHGYLQQISAGNLPENIINKFFPSILVVGIITIFITIYLRYTKHGYELSVVGESEPTAKYAGINVKKVIIRTMALSGAICGIIGFLIVAGFNHTISASALNSRGFTAIIVAWLAKFDPIYMILTSFLVVFLQRGSSQLISDIGITNDALCDIIVGIFFFFIIGFEFFVRYEVKFRKKNKEVKNDNEQVTPQNIDEKENKVSVENKEVA